MGERRPIAAQLPFLLTMAEAKAEKVQCFGRKKTAVAVALVRTGSGLVRVNGCPIHTGKPDILRVKVYEPLLLLGKVARQGWWLHLTDLRLATGTRDATALAAAAV